MIESPAAKVKPSIRSRLNRIGIFTIGALCIGVLTFLILKHTDAPRINDRAATSAQPAVEKRSIEDLKLSALAKLQSGKKQEGLSELKSALTKAKAAKSTADITYLQQQIDFAQNSNFSKPATAPPPAESIDTKDPSYITTNHK